MPANPTATSAPHPRGISLLWKTEDWLAVWVGFLVIVLVLAGLPVKIPKFKWTTDGASAARATQARDARVVETLEAAAAQKGDRGRRRPAPDGVRCAGRA